LRVDRKPRQVPYFTLSASNTRELGVYNITWESWTLAAEADRRFRRIVAAIGAPVFAFAAWVGFLQFESSQTKQGAVEGVRFIELTVPQTEITSAAPPNPAGAEAISAASDKPVIPPKLPEQPKQSFAKPAGTEAEDAPSILVVKRGQIDTGNQHPNLITSRQPLVPVSNPPWIAQTKALSRPNEAADHKGASSAPGKSESPVKASQLQSTGPSSIPTSIQPEYADQPRNIQEVQQVFGRNGTSLNAIYIRRAGSNLDMGDGKIVINFTVAPNGSVTDCSVVSSTFKDPVFEGRIVAQIRLFRFLPKQVPVFVSPHYTIEFHGA
jgi:TonB family protein